MGDFAFSNYLLFTGKTILPLAMEQRRAYQQRYIGDSALVGLPYILYIPPIRQQRASWDQYDVGVYGYDVSMEIKHFRAPRKMHTFPLANPWNLPSRSHPKPSSSPKLVSKDRQLHTVRRTIKIAPEGSRYAPSEGSPER